MFTKRNFLSVLMVMVLITGLLPVPRAAARSLDAPDAWFDSAWSYRKGVNITNTGGSALTDYQVLVTLDATFNFSHAKSDGSDIRFATEGGTSLPYWIESWTPGSSLARIWVKVASIPTSGTTIYLYYGNPAAASASSGTSTFVFFDDDWTSLTSRWALTGGAPSVSGGIVAFTSGKTMQTSGSYGPGVALGYRGWFKSGGGAAYKWGGFLNGVNTPYTYIGTVGEASLPNVVLTNNTGTRYSTSMGLPIDTFHIYEMAWTTSVVRAFLDRSTTPAGSLTQGIPTSALPIQLGNYNDNNPAGETFDVDWVYLRKYQEPEPTYTLGSEESNTSADLELTLTDSPDPVMAGSSLTYAITITNHGPMVAADVVLTDVLPAGVTFGLATPSQGSCSGTSTVTCNLGSIANSGIATVSIVVTPTGAGTLSNTPTVASSTPDYNTGNNSATASTVVNAPTSADLGITKSASPEPVKVSNPLTYTLTVTNYGPATATGVVVTDTLPGTITFGSATPSQGTCSGTAIVTCNLGTIANAGTATVTIVVTPLAAGSLTNQASVDGMETDPNSSNDSATATTHVTAPSLGAVVLVNSNSATYSDFSHFIQPYLDNFGVPYSVLDIATVPVGTEIQDYALIIIGHRQIDIGNSCSGSPCLSSTEQSNISAAVAAGTGLLNFDDDLTANGSTARYQFIQDIFNFGYVAAPSGSGVLFTTAAGSHFITSRHTVGESISTGSMTLAGVTLPGDATSLATSGGNPFLVVRNSGSGHAVQFGSYAWMSYSVKGPVYGLDDLLWRGMAWAARKPFVMQGMPPFLTMRVDDESGPFDWIHVANEVGIKPWAGIFLSNIDETEAADLSALVNAGNATTAIHAFNGGWFYWAQSDTQIAANFATGTAWHTNHNIPISKYILPHYYQFGSNAFSGLNTWGVECVGTQMPPDQGYGASWIMNGPYRKYESGSSSSGIPNYYADYMSIPGHPEFDGRFFNLVTEIRDDLGYEWYPNNDVTGTIYHGTLQTRRAFDSMVLATLFTHDQSVSGISMANWRSILQGITANISSYNPINVTMDYACQYVKSKYNSKIASSSYDSASRLVTVNYTGNTQIATKFYLFMEDQSAIRDLWVDVPQFTGSTQVLFTLPGALDHIVVTPSTATLVSGGTQQFSATGYDASNNPIPNLPFTWSVVSGGGTINSSGLFTAGSTPGTYTGTVRATFGTLYGSASVEVTGPTLHHFTFQTITSPKYDGSPFQVTITARDSAGNLFSGFTGTAALTASAGTISPTDTGNFGAGSWTGNVTISSTTGSVTITANGGGVSGTSNSFTLQTLPTLHHFTFQAISSPQVVNSPFQVTITAYDSSNTPLPVYNGHPALSASLGTVTPAVTGDFSGSSWTGTVALDTVGTGITLTVTDGSASGISNSFAIQPPPPLYQVTSLYYDQAATIPFDVTVTAFQTTINLWEDTHQSPVLAQTTDPAVLTYNSNLGQWTEFLYTPSRPFPSIMNNASFSGTLPTMHFYANGIPNGRYQVYANLYDNASMRYYYGYTSADPKALSVVTAGGLGGTQHQEYNLGTVDITDNSFNLYVNDADWLSGQDYYIFGWAWIRLAPAQPVQPSTVTINLYEDSHQDPVLATTQDVNTLLSNSANHLWTEFLYTTSRPYPSIMGSYQHSPLNTTMHFFASGLTNGQYQVYANLYNTNPIRYYYGYTSGNPQASYVDTIGGATGTQHTEYSLGTITITNGSYDLYVNHATQLPGATYDIFGWAWIRLVPQFTIPNVMTLTSSSPTLLFDGDGDSIFGEPGDNVKALVNGTFTINAVDSAVGGTIITATDWMGQNGGNSYTFVQPTAVSLSSFNGKAKQSAIQLDWETASEVKLLGFNLYRSNTLDGPRQKQNTHLIQAQRPGQLVGAGYQFSDPVSPGKRYYYWLEWVGVDGAEITGPLVVNSDFLIHLPVIVR